MDFCRLQSLTPECLLPIFRRRRSFQAQGVSLCPPTRRVKIRHREGSGAVDLLRETRHCPKLVVALSTFQSQQLRANRDWKEVLAPNGVHVPEVSDSNGSTATDLPPSSCRDRAAASHERSEADSGEQCQDLSKDLALRAAQEGTAEDLQSGASADWPQQLAVNCKKSRADNRSVVSDVDGTPPVPPVPHEGETHATVTSLEPPALAEKSSGMKSNNLHFVSQVASSEDWENEVHPENSVHSEFQEAHDYRLASLPKFSPNPRVEVFSSEEYHDELRGESGSNGTLVGGPDLTETLTMQGKSGTFPGKSLGSGLLRTPTTGGVQSATSSHGLPDPAVAVRNIVAQSKHAHLCTIMSRMHHRRTGYPFACLVDFANDASGHPIFFLSSLAIHARNLLADPRCTLVVQIPGWSGLADARVTIFGEVYPVPIQLKDWASRVFTSQHHQKASEQWGNSHFFRMDHIRDIYFVGGFGTVAWVDVEDYLSVQPDRIASENCERTLENLNERVSHKLKESLMLLVKEGGAPVDKVSFIAVDSKGVDIRVQQGHCSHVRRVSFECDKPIEVVEEAEAALEDLISRSALPSGLVDQEV